MADWFNDNGFDDYYNTGINPNPYDPGPILTVADGNSTDRATNVGPWAAGYGPQPENVVVPESTPEPGQSSASNLAGIQDPRNWTPELLQAYYESRGGRGPWSEIPAWMGYRDSLITRGQQLNDPGYGFMRLSLADSLTPPEQRYQAGSSVLGGLSEGDLLKPFTENFKFEDFKAPTEADLQADSGFQATLNRASDILQRSAASKGSLLSGSTAQELVDRTADLTQGAYRDLFGRNLQTYATNRGNAYESYQARRANHYQNQDSPFAKLFSLAGLESNERQFMDNLNLQYAGLGANTIRNGANVANEYGTSGANATAAGQVGAGNAYAGLFGNLSQLPYAWDGLRAARRGVPYDYSDQRYGY